MKILVDKKGKVTIKDDGKTSFELYTEEDVYFEDIMTRDKCKMVLGAPFNNIHIFSKMEE